MRVGILGSGLLGGKLGTIFARAGHEVVFSYARPVQGSAVAFVLGPGGKPNVLGDGSASVVITGQVVDKEGNILGDLFEMEGKAVIAWETLLAEYGIDAAHREGDAV